MGIEAGPPDRSCASSRLLYLVAGCPADVTGDGVVNVDDLVAVISAWGTAAADVDGNGVVGVDDLITIISAWGNCPE